MKFCSLCAGLLALAIPHGDNRLRYICQQCGYIHYQNPKIVAGCLIEAEGRILLCRRAIEPRLGLWTLPAGFLENEETVEEGAKRETLEETRARVNVRSLLAMYSIPHISQVYMIFRADLLTPEFGPTLESSEVAFFSEQEIPWPEVAFAVIERLLSDYFAVRHQTEFGLLSGVIEKRVARS